MKLAIDVSENLYKATVNGLDANEILDLRLAVKNGIPLDKPHIKGDYYDGFKNGLRTAKWRYDKIRAEIEAYQSDAFYSDDVMMNKRTVLGIIDKYRNEVSS